MPINLQNTILKETDSDQLVIYSLLTNLKCDFNSDHDSENEHSSYMTDPSGSNDLAIVSALFIISWHIQYN